MEARWIALKFSRLPGAVNSKPKSLTDGKKPRFIRNVAVYLSVGLQSLA